MDRTAVEESIERGVFHANTSADDDKRTLLVCVPGWRLRPSAFKPLLLSLLQEDFLAHSDLLPYAYRNGRLSNADPEQVARELAAKLEDAHTTRGYRAIYLLGHSIGALIIRRAFLFGHDHKSEWVSANVRLVLLAGTNRGFSPSLISDKLSAFLISLFNLPVASLIMSCQRGSPWVTGLRMRWLRRFTDGGKRPPDIVQFYGSLDSVVPADDAMEVNRFDNARFVSLAGVTHEGFGAISGESDRHHYATIRDAFLDKVHAPFAAPHEKRDRLVFLIHGIRDFAEWQEALEYEIENLQQEAAVVPVQYGYFNILQFLWPHQRKRAVRIFVDRYVQEVSKSPSATVAVGAHSNGTYVFERAIRNSPFMEVERAYLAGCVLPRRIRWSDDDHSRVRQVCNVTATKDWPVGFLCSALKWLYPSMGTAGYHGFVDDPSVENRRLAGRHGVALAPHHRKEVARYLIGEDVDLPDSDAPMSRVLKFVSPAAWACVLGVLGAIGHLYWQIADKTGGPGLAVALSAVATLFFVWLLQKV